MAGIERASCLSKLTEWEWDGASETESTTRQKEKWELVLFRSWWDWRACSIAHSPRPIAQLLSQFLPVPFLLVSCTIFVLIVWFAQTWTPRYVSYLPLFISVGFNWIRSIFLAWLDSVRELGSRKLASDNLFINSHRVATRMIEQSDSLSRLWLEQSLARRTQNRHVDIGII